MIATLLEQHSRILTECAVAERLRRHPEITLHPTLYNAPLIYGPDHALTVMRGIYHEYLKAAEEAQRPLLLMSPTWRVDPKRIAETEVPHTINTDAVDFMLSIRQEYASTTPVAVGGLSGPKNDCYRPDLAPDTVEAEAFHVQQISELAQSGADFLQTQTLPSVNEAIGIASAMAATSMPYIISFCINPNGCVLDGTTLPNAFEAVDTSVKEPPVAYFVNCTHPNFLLKRYSPGDLDRLKGIQANGSSKDVTQLEGASETEADPVETWAQSMLKLHEYHGVPVLGGCCGTTLAHLQALC